MPPLVPPWVARDSEMLQTTTMPIATGVAGDRADQRTGRAEDGAAECRAGEYEGDVGGAEAGVDVIAGSDREDDGHRGAREDRCEDGADGGVGDGVRRGDPSSARVDEVGHRDRAAAELVADDVRRVGGDHDDRQLRQPAQLSDHLVRASSMRR